jgi:hypothetical protein
VPFTDTGERRLGIVGAGKMGTTIARLAMAAGYGVAISGSGPAERIALIVEVLAPGALARSTAEVAAYANLIVLVVPMHRFRDLPRELFAGKVVIDAMNYWKDIDGIDSELADAPEGTSVVVQEWFASARVVKSFNQLGYDELATKMRAPGQGGHEAISVAGDDPDAVSTVMQFIDRLGFESVDVGSLVSGRALEIAP